MSELIDRQALKNKLKRWDECDPYEFVEIAFHAIEDAPTIAASTWHRVEDELPKFGEYVLAWEIQGFAVVDKYVGIGDGRWDLENVGAIYTHWMPLPEPPKEDA